VVLLVLSAGLALPGTGLFAQTPEAPNAPKESRAHRLQKILNPDQAERTANAGQPTDIPNPTANPVSNPAPTPAISAPTPVPPQPAAVQPATPTPVAPTPVPAPAVATPPASVANGPATVAPSAATISAAISKQPPAAVKSVQIVHDKHGPAIEILTSRPVPPALQTLPAPPRLVIDLPNASVAVKQRQVASAKGEQFASLRVDQFQVTPPVTRVTVDLVAANQYTWDAAGNRLMIRLKGPEAAKPQPPTPAQPTTVSTFGSGANAAVVPVTTSSSGSMVLTGSRIGNGSSVTATAETAVLHIARGGEVHVCPGTTVSVTASKTGQELMLGMSSGSLETHYHVGASSDTVLTPDFRVQLAGPGDFDYAISSNARGDTCVRALLGNDASAMVTELMGDRSYQVKPTEQVVFHEGRIDRISNDVPPECGCPGTSRPAVMLASTSPNPPISDANVPSNVRLASGAAPGFRASIDPMLGPMPTGARAGMGTSSGSQVNIASMGPETAPLPPAKPNDIHVQIVAPFTFRGTDPAPAPVTKAQNLPVKPAGTTQAKLDEPVLPPPSVPAPKPPDPINADPPKKQHRGLFGRIKGLFSAAFK
jgi:AMIN domain